MIRETLWGKERERLGGILGFGEPVPEEMLYSMLQDSNYRHHIFVSRNVPQFLEHLRKTPTVRELTMSQEQAQEEVEKLVSHYETVLPGLKRKEAYQSRYGVYLTANQKRGENCKSREMVQPDDFREVYMDYNATTMLSPVAAQAMKDYADGSYGFGNPGTITVQGDYVADLILKARKEVAEVIHAKPEEIYFTGGGSEANNLAIKGIALQHLKEKGHIITTAMEHSSVLETVRFLEELGFEATYLKPDAEGQIEVSAVAAAIRQNTILVAVMAANNEIGTLYPIQEIAKVCEKAEIPFFTDGVQAFGKIPIDASQMKFTMLSCSAHKIHGPKGIGALYVRKGTRLTPLIHGGGQERGLRSGTENVGHILAMGVAAREVAEGMKEERKKLEVLRKELMAGIRKAVPEVVFFGPKENRLPGLVSAGFPGVSGNQLIRNLNQIGICISAGSACSARKKSASHVLQAIGADTEHMAVLRFGMGRFSTEEDVSYVIRYLKRALEASRNNIKIVGGMNDGI